MAQDLISHSHIIPMSDRPKIPGTVFAYLCLGKLDEKRVYRIGRTKKVYVEGGDEKTFIKNLKHGAGLNKPKDVLILCQVRDLESGWELFRDLFRGHLSWGTQEDWDNHPRFALCNIAGDAYYTAEWDPSEVAKVKAYLTKGCTKCLSRV